MAKRILLTRHHRPRVVVSAMLVFVLGLGIQVLFPTRVAWAAACATADLTMSRVSSAQMYVDTGISPALTGMYAGYRLTNAGTGIDDAWVRVTGFAGGTVGLAAEEDGLVHLGPLPTSATGFAYVYLAASGSGTAQTHQVQVYEGHPSFGGTQLCSEGYSLSVHETIKANANKVTTVVSGPNPAQLGGIMTMTVTGQTGQIGDGPPGHPNGLGVFAATAATAADWPADSYQLVDVSITFATSGTFDDTLVVSGLNGTSQAYEAQYTFVAVGTTGAPTSVTPVNYIASGTQIKHTDTGGFASLDPIAPTENRLTLAKTADPDTLAGTGGMVEYTVTLANAGAVDAAIDDFTITLPAGAAFVPGSATYGGVGIDDPYQSGQTLVFVGVFTAPAGGSADLVYEAELAGITGTYVNSVVGHVASTQIDTSLDTSASDPATAVVTVGDPNDAPTAIDDSLSTSGDTPATWNLVANDIDPDGNLDPATLVVLSGPTYGDIVNHADGTVTYTPAPGFDGGDSFTYRVCDTEGACATATVGITVLPSNDPPTASDDARSTGEDTPVTVDVAANDVDPDGNLDAATVTVVGAAGDGSAVSNGDGTITYTPGPEFAGSDSLTYEVCDTEGACDTATVTVAVVPVADPPDALDDAVSTDEDTGATWDLVANDSDPDGDLDATTATILSGPDHGSVVNNGDGTVTYTPHAQFSGTDSLLYQVCDTEGICDGATATITVDAIADVPLASDDATTTAEDTPVIVDVVANDFDPDGDLDATSVTVPAPPASASVLLNGDGTITVTPDPGFTGTLTFDYSVCDGDSSCAVATVVVGVTGTDETPVAVDDAVSTDEDVPATWNLAGNDTDSDGDLDPTTLTVVSGPDHGTLVDHGDGTVTYTSHPGFAGADGFVYDICDLAGSCDTATVTVTVDPVDDPPVGRADGAATPEDSAVTLDVAANDTDPDGDLDPTTVTVLDGPSNGVAISIGDGTVGYTPNPDFAGTDSFTYEICDLAGACTAPVTVSLVVNAVDDPPAAADDTVGTAEDVAATWDLAANDTDPDGDLDPSTLSTLAVASHGVVVDNGDGTVTYTPDPAYDGADGFTYQVCDAGGRCDPANVSITVAGSNDAPIAGDDARNIAEGAAGTWALTGNDTDPEGGLDPTTLAITDAAADGVAVSNGDGTVTYTPDTGFVGTDTFEYEVCDDLGACDTATVTVTVTNIAETPDAADDAETTGEDTPLTFDPTGNDTDPDGDLDPTTVAIIVPPTNGVAVANGDGTITHTSDRDFSGSDGLVYEVCDADGSCDTASVTIVVTPANDAPIARNDWATADEDGAVVIVVLGNDDDADDGLDTDTVSVIGGPGHGSVVVNPNGSVEYTPDPDYAGTDSFTYRVCDMTATCDTATVTVTVAPLADPPVANNDAASTEEAKPVRVRVTANDSDRDGNLLASTLAITDQPSHGDVVVMGNGVVEYTPGVGYFGVDTFTYRVCDSTGRCDTATVTVTVGDGNAAPVADDEEAETYEDTPVDIDLLAGDGDTDGELVPSSVKVVDGPGHGSVVVDPVSGLATYTPVEDFAGLDTFDYRVCDDEGACTVATVVVTVVASNDPPAYTGGPTYAVSTSGDLPTLTFEDPDGDGYWVTVVSGTTPPGATLNPDGTWSGEPIEDGTYTFTVKVCDDGEPVLCSTSVVSVVVGDLPFTGLPMDVLVSMAAALMVGGLLLLRWRPGTLPGGARPHSPRIGRDSGAI